MIAQLKAKIRDVPDFPKPGILFKDLTPLLRDANVMQLTVSQLALPFHDKGVTAVVGIEARGFIFGPLVAQELGVGFVPLRKPGKLPYRTRQTSYDLEYGSASLEIHEDALNSHDKIVLVDDLLATGGTAKASCHLIESLGAAIVGCAFVVELDFLKGRDRLISYSVHALLHY